MSLPRLVRSERLVVICVLAAIAGVFLHVSLSNPPGFMRDESAITYNAYTLSMSGKDEYGARFPLFIKSFGDWKSPLYTYLLAGVFRVTGLSIFIAREFSAVLGLAAIFVIYTLAAAISRRRLLGLAVAMLAGLSPWLFDISRLVIEVALMPFVLALLLLVVYQASAGTWRLRYSIAIGLLLAALAYTYQVGRILAPLLAVGVTLFWARRRVRQIAAVWGVFVAGVVPIAFWSHAHSGALESRYHATTFIHSGMSWWAICRQFLTNYAHNMNLWAWARHGDPGALHHVQGAGSLFFVEVALAIAGVVVVLLHRRSDPFWWFVIFGVLVSPVAASLVTEPYDSVRMIALPVFLPLLALPALESVAALSLRNARVAIALLAVVFAVEAAHWQIVYQQNGDDASRQAAFEVSTHSLIKTALKRGNTLYVFRFDHTVYINALLDRALMGGSPPPLVVLDDTRPPAGAYFVAVQGECPQCPGVLGISPVELYRYRPTPPGVLRTNLTVTPPLPPIAVGGPIAVTLTLTNRGARPADHVILTVELPPGMRLAGEMRLVGPTDIIGFYGCKGSTTLVCNIGYFPGKLTGTYTYAVQVVRGGPQTMTAALTSDKLDVNPDGTGSAFTIDLSPPAYARSSSVPR